jgi:putative phage-type endonuclease
MEQKLTYLCDLPDLEDIIDFIEPTNEININSVQIMETMLEMIDTYITENPHAIAEPNFEEVLIEEVIDFVILQIDDYLFDLEQDDIEELAEYSIDYYFEFVNPPRSYSDTIILELPDIPRIQEQLIYLKSKPQPVQRTPEWYKTRHNLITASNAYKAFENQNVKNQLIYEKCLPLIISSTTSSSQQVNINTTLHWGQKYEPLSVLLYEYLYQTKVDDFGCIPHDKYKFIGASPDGINVDPTSPRYGRMLEIKNIVNREIDGIPKKEYWVQMQMQMETCDLPECDFLETKFEEFASIEEFHLETEKRKGIIMYFANNEGNPQYKYSPLDITTYEDLEKWETEMLEKTEMTWIQNYYWKLEILSCVLVPRNKRWFEANVKDLEDVWETVLQERTTGYEHRAPNKRAKPVQTCEPEVIESVCLIDFSGKLR